MYRPILCTVTRACRIMKGAFMMGGASVLAARFAFYPTCLQTINDGT